jgi:threonylcarbamoyladenosine tRNA methylthiotransferase MtaB
MPKIAFASVGCKLNRYEVQLMAEALKPFEFSVVPFNKQADCYVINTCSVTGDADLSSRQLIRQARRRLQSAKVVVTGCYAQLRPDLIAELNADLVISNRDKQKLPTLILNLFGIENHNLSDTALWESTSIAGMDGLTRAFVKIEDGCDDQCTFCTIWIARGPVISRPTDHIIEEINKLSLNSYKEIALTGVHIGKYNFDGKNFTGLLKKLLQQTSIDRIRLSSLNPTEITDNLLELIQSNRRLCPHIHLSLQSGDSRILKLMGRKYTSEDIQNVIEKLLTVLPYITIGADFIVGFPGETGEMFENTKRLIENAEIHHLHIFPYSSRPGTAAENFIDKIEPRKKDERSQILRQLGKSNKLLHLKKFIGRRLNVLFENRESTANEMLTGLSENYLRICAPGPDNLKGKIMEVEPHKIIDDKLISRIIIGTAPDKNKLTIL